MKSKLLTINVHDAMLLDEVHRGEWRSVSHFGRSVTSGVRNAKARMDDMVRVGLLETEEQLVNEYDRLVPQDFVRITYAGWQQWKAVRKPNMGEYTCMLTREDRNSEYTAVCTASDYVADSVLTILQSSSAVTYCRSRKARLKTHRFEPASAMTVVSIRWAVDTEEGIAMHDRLREVVNFAQLRYLP